MRLIPLRVFSKGNLKVELQPGSARFVRLESRVRPHSNLHGKFVRWTSGFGSPLAFRADAIKLQFVIDLSVAPESGYLVGEWLKAYSCRLSNTSPSALPWGSVVGGLKPGGQWLLAQVE